MAQYTRRAVIQTIHAQGMMPLFYHGDIDTARNALKACYDGGGRLLEFTNRGDFAHEVFGELVKYSLKELPGMIVGAGSIHDPGTASLYMQLGANFIVSPVLDAEVARVCNRRKVLWAPGCGSATEIARAEELGAEIVKVFPGNTLGPDFVSAVLGPTPWTSIMPTGGVSPTRENLEAWFNAGVVCVGMGSKLISGDLLSRRDFAEITRRIRDALQLIQEIRSADA